MTSRQIRASLTEATAIIAECARLLEDPYAQDRNWDLVHLKHRAQDFLVDMRDQQGGQP